MKRSLTAALLLAFLVPAPLALAQGDGVSPAPAAELVYDLYQAGQHLGEAGMTLERAGTGTTANSYVTVTGLFEASDTLVTNPDGSAREYRLAGTVQGAPFAVEVAFTDAGADLTITQGGASQSLALPADAPLYVLDNNFIDGYQIAADQVLAAGEGRTFPVLIPQAAMLASMTFEAPAAGRVEYLGDTVDATRLQAVFEVGFQPLAITIHLDDAGDILVLEQQPGAIRFVRRAADGAAQEDGAAAEPGAGEDAQAEGAAGPAAPVPGAAAATVERSLEEAEACLVEREVQIGSTGETLHGKLTLPLAAAAGSGRPAPTLLLLPGSGAVDMDGNVPPLIGNFGYKQLAYELACHGYGVLRAAKLGLPPSTGDGNAVTLGTYVSNAADWLLFLAEQPGVDPNRLGVIGHSEGGLIALAAAAEGRIQPDVVVLIAAAGRPFDVLIREQLLASFERAGLTGENLRSLEADIDEALESIRGVEGTTLAIEGELVGNQVAAAFAHAAGLLRSEFEQDPRALAAAVEAPTLVLQGLKDIQVSRADAAILAAALPRATLLEFPNLGHNLNEVPGDPLSGAVPTPDTGVSPTLVQALATWLHGYLRVAR